LKPVIGNFTGNRLTGNRFTTLVLMVAVTTKTVSFHLSRNKVLDAHVHGWMDRQTSEKPNASSHYVGCRLALCTRKENVVVCNTAVNNGLLKSWLFLKFMKQRRHLTMAAQS